MKYSPSQFFDLFLKELEQNAELRGYYRFLNNESLFGFRKAYFIQRLQYVDKQINDKSSRILDIGCGYGTTAIFLVLNGFKVIGTTLEFYYEQIEKRLKFWGEYGNLDNLVINYENLFDSPPPENSFDVVIAQDVLHHLEPLQEALEIISIALSPNGKLIACEENGHNLLNSTRLFLKRGNKKVVEIYDEKLKKNILLGNENIRTMRRWKKELEKQKIHIIDNEVEYIRLYPPSKFHNNSIELVIEKEQQIWKNNPLLKKYFFHGVSFTACKTSEFNDLNKKY